MYEIFETKHNSHISKCKRLDSSIRTKNIFILTYKENIMRMESPEINSCKCGQIIYNKGAKNIQPSLCIHWVLLLGPATDTKNSWILKHHSWLSISTNFTTTEPTTEHVLSLLVG